MSLAQAERVSLESATELTNDERQIVAVALNDMFFWAGTSGIKLAKDDRLAKLEAALIHYVLDSRKQLH